MTVKPRTRESRLFVNRTFATICIIAASCSVIVLGILLLSIGIGGFPQLSFSFLNQPPSGTASEAGIGPALWGTVWICLVCAAVALPLGVGTAIFLEEYKPRNRLLKVIHSIVQLNISNLAGVPSIVYGLLGLTVFVNMFGLFGSPRESELTIGVTWYDSVYDAADHVLLVRVDNRSAPETEFRTGMEAFAELSNEVFTVKMMTQNEIDALRAEYEARAATLPADDVEGQEQLRIEMLGGVVAESEYVQRFDVKSWYYLQLPFGRSVLAGGLTLMLVVLPIIIISAQEAIRSVPNSLRHGALGLGATKWQMIRQMTLPAAIPGIMTGSILAMSRAIGEAAPILIITGIVFVRFTPEHLMDEFTAMPLQIYNWASRPQEEFHAIAATGIIVLLAILLTFNATAVFIRQRFTKPLK